MQSSGGYAAQTARPLRVRNARGEALDPRPSRPLPFRQAAMVRGVTCPAPVPRPALEVPNMASLIAFLKWLLALLSAFLVGCALATPFQPNATASNAATNTAQANPNVSVQLPGSAANSRTPAAAAPAQVPSGQTPASSQPAP